MKQYKVPEFRRAIAQFANKLHSHLNLRSTLTIQWSNEITTAGIDGRGVLYLADIDDDKVVTHGTLVKYCGFVVHELCHRKWTNFSVKEGHAYIDQLFNAVEDAWIEHQAINTSLTNNVESLLTTLVDMMVTQSLAEVQDWSDPRQYPFILAIFLRDHAQTKVPVPQGLEPIFKGAKDRLASSKSSTDNLAIAKWVYDQLKMLPQNPPQNPPKPSQSDDRGQGKGEGTPEGEPKVNARQPSKCDEVDPVNVEPNLTTDSGTYGSYSEDAGLEPAERVLNTHDQRLIQTLAGGKLRHEVRRLFDNTGYESWQLNRKSGAVNVHALPMVGHSENLFKRRQEVEGIDSAVVVVLDVSGSMKGKQLDIACDACATLIDTLGRAQVSVCLMAFGSWAHILLPFDTNYRKAKSLLAKLVTCGNTNDYFAVRYAHQMLSMRPEQRKVCFVLSDGDGHVIRTKHQVKVGERMGITTIGVGIKHDVSNVYSKAIEVNKLEDLGTATFKQIKLAV
jgi:uncharacterized protein YegL